MTSGSQEPASEHSLLQCVLAASHSAPGLRLAQLVLFLHVAGTDGLRIGELARLCGDSEATTSRNVRAMMAPGQPGALPPGYGLVMLMRNETDGRVRHVGLTDKGRALHRLMLARLAGPT